MRRSRKRKGIGIYGFWLLFLLMILLLISTRVNKISILGNQQYSEEELKKQIFSEDLDYNAMNCIGRARFPWNLSSMKKTW